MENEVLIKVEGVSKKFCKDLKRSLWYGLVDIAAEFFGIKKKKELRKDEFWAVNDVSFELRRGECLGLIGHNGAGKSTLLKMLNGLIKPDKGTIRMKGQVGALIELGAGFNPVLTGRENVYVYGAVLGFSQKEINAKYKDIVEFAELEEFMETPVQNYSSGMKVRLGFAVAAQMEPDVLIIDEVLAVGDVGFKTKCYNTIYSLMRSSAIIFVSHAMPQISKICNRAMMLKNGQVNLSSNQIAKVVLKYYEQFAGGQITKQGNGRGEIRELLLQQEGTQCAILNFDNVSQQEFSVKSGQSIKFIALIKLDISVRSISIVISFLDIDQKLVSQIIVGNSNCKSVHNNQYKVEAKMANLYLNTGKYFMSIQVFEKSNQVDRGELIVGITNIFQLQIQNHKFIGAAPIIFHV